MRTLTKEELLKAYYKKSRYRGRGRAAVFIDKAFLFAVASAAMWLAVRTRMRNNTAAVMLTAIIMLCSLMMSRIVSEMLLERHIKKLRELARKELSELKASISLKELCGSIFDGDVFVHSGAEALTADDVLAAYERGRKTIITAAVPTEKALKLMKYLNIKAVTPYEHLNVNKYEFYAVGEDEIDELLLAEAEEHSCRSRRKRAGFAGVLAKERAPKYFCCGLLLMLLSFAARSALYYRLLGSLSMLMGTFVLRSDLLFSKRKEAA